MAGTSSGLGVDFGSVIVSDDIASSGPPALYLDEKNGLGREGRSQGASVPIVSHPDLVKTGGLAACGCYQIAIADSLECFITNGLSPPPIISYMGGWATESIDRIRVEDASGEASAASNQHQNHPDRERDRDGRRTAYPSLVVRSRRDKMTSTWTLLYCSALIFTTSFYCFGTANIASARSVGRYLATVVFRGPPIRTETRGERAADQLRTV